MYDWTAGRELCGQYDMNYVTFASNAEAVYYSSKIVGFVYVGISDQVLEGTFKEYDGKMDSVGTLLNWNNNEPNNGGGSNEDCVQVTANRYNDYPCNLLLKAGCMSEISFRIESFGCFNFFYFCVEDPHGRKN